MKKLRIMVVLTFTVILIYFSFYFDSKLGVQKDIEQIESNIIVNDDQVLNVKKVNHEVKVLGEDGFHTLIGQPLQFVKEKYGEPERIDLSAYDYEWWIYSDVFDKGYFQLGIEEEKVVSAYVIGASNLPTSPFQIGTSYDELNTKFKFEDQVSFNISNNSYQFNLSQEEVKTRPLLYLDGVFIQLYFDTFLNELSSIRYLNHESIIKHRPYSVVYRGELIEALPLTASNWREVEIGASQQVFSITNQIRMKHGLQPLKWDEATANVAYRHSEDMNVNNYFSHTSELHGELKDRLKKEEILYMLAGENIAAKYVDAIEAVEGWLNSEGHRVNLLHEEFTHLGVGVYERYYTQNFITPW